MGHKQLITFLHRRLHPFKIFPLGVLDPLRSTGYALVRLLRIHVIFIWGLQACNIFGPASPPTSIPLTAPVETSVVVDEAHPTHDEAHPTYDGALSLHPELTPEPTSTPLDTPTPAATLTASLTTAPSPGNPHPLGYSTNLNPIEVYQFGNGPERMVFIGGIHGGYEWNTILLAYKAIDYFVVNPDQVPPGVSLYIIPAANPDGQVQVVGHSGRFTSDEVGLNTKPGRFNGAMVDLNRNWDCNWSPVGKWGDSDILTGTEAFSEVETRILRDFLLGLPADKVVFWHSAASAVYAAGCGEPYEPAVELASRYAEGSGYVYQDSFMAYAVTGDATDWLSTVDIPAITVELSNHSDLEWERNLKAILTLMEYYAGP
jgi:hypothetical protein